jgi:hypothetical protein
VCGSVCVRACARARVCVAVAIKHAKRMCRVVLSCPLYPINGTTFRKKVIEHKMCVLVLYIVFLEHFSF